MDVNLLAIVGLALTFITCIGGLIVRDRAVLSIISAGDKSVRDEMIRDTAVLHERINKTRDEFVRRDDLDQHLSRIEKSLRDMYTEQRETNKRIDGFMSAMVSANDTHNAKL